VKVGNAIIGERP